MERAFNGITVLTRLVTVKSIMPLGTQVLAPMTQVLNDAMRVSDANDDQIIVKASEQMDMGGGVVRGVDVLFLSTTRRIATY